MYTIIYAIKSLGHNARLKDNEYSFLYRAQLEGNFFRCVRARANDTKSVRSTDAQFNTEELHLKYKDQKQSFSSVKKLQTLLNQLCLKGL